MLDSSVAGTVIAGHGVASGQNKDPRFPGGTLVMQQPYFAKLGLDLSEYHLATLNVSIKPLDYHIVNADWHFEAVQWHPVDLPEDFSFVEVEVEAEKSANRFKGLLYSPHPETKPDHFQPDGMMEIILRKYVDSIQYDSALTIHFNSAQIELVGHC